MKKNLKHSGNHSKNAVQISASFLEKQAPNATLTQKLWFYNYFIFFVAQLLVFLLFTEEFLVNPALFL